MKKVKDKQSKKNVDPFYKREASKYESPIYSREYILECLQSTHEQVDRETIDKLLGIKSEFKKEALRRRLRAMVRDGQLIRTRSGKYRVVKPQDVIVGHAIGHKDGHGYLLPSDGTSKIMLRPNQMRSVIDGDLVSVKIIDSDDHNRREGVVLEIVERKTSQIIGRFYIEPESGIGFVEPDNRKINHKIIIPKEHQLNAKDGQIVIVLLTKYPEKNSLAIGKIKEVLGNYMDPGLEIDVAIRSFHLPYAWSDNVTKETLKIKQKISQSELSLRLDLRDLPFVTIDGEDAKDFDDAVYCEPMSHGSYKLFVAIADVAHYVRSNTALDSEAYERGTSVYFPEKVVPMLPEILSNELCSLKEGVDRLVLVCEMIVGVKGEVTNYKFYEAVIHSHGRLFYNEVAKLYNKDSISLYSENEKLTKNLFNLYDVFKNLYMQREKRGALNFEMEEYQIEFGEKRKIKKLVPIVRNDAHKVIEEIMIAANVSAAKFINKHKSAGLYRVHDAPNGDKFSELKEFLKSFGLSIDCKDLPKSIDYTRVINAALDKPFSHIVQISLLRSLTRAVYTPEIDDHFGLGLESYAHFTSPIRRYPDLFNHRMIKAILNKKQEEYKLPIEQLKKIGEQCSYTERRADDAVRDVISWLKCEYMLDRVGEIFNGVISQTTGFGIFIELNDIYVEGMIHISDLKDDYYIYDKVKRCLIGDRTKKKYRIGDEIKVKVVRVDLDRKEIDFVQVKKK